jgi:hypothetical protein
MDGYTNVAMPYPMRLELEGLNAELRALLDKYADVLADVDGGDLANFVDVTQNWLDAGEYPRADSPTP